MGTHPIFESDFDCLTETRISDFAMVHSVNTSKIVRKRNKRFHRHQADRFDRVDKSWRKPIGIDSRVRRRFKGQYLMPSIGYGTKAADRHRCKDQKNFKRFVVKNVAELNVLMMNTRVFCAEIAHAVSAKKRKEIIERAEQLDVHVTKKNARVRSQDNE